MGKKAGNLFTTAYLLLIFGIYPFYMEQGYVDIGKAKYHFFLYCSLAGTGILLLSALACGAQALLTRYKCRNAFCSDLKGLSLTDIFVLLFSTELFLSFVHSQNRREAFWGTEGWYMGLLLFLILCSLYFFISRLWTKNPLISYVGVAASGIVFILGILDRFSLYLIPLEVRQPGFISTLGNINWFCGYLSVLSPLGICPLIFSPGKNARSRRQMALSVLYTILAFTAGFCQGSNSIFLFWGALLFILLWIASFHRAWLTNCLLPVFLWCFSALLVRGLLLLFPKGYNYEADNPCLYLARSNLVPLAGVIALILFLFLKRKTLACLPQKASGEISLLPDPRLKKAVHLTLALSLIGGLLVWLLLSFVNTRKGIPFLSGSSLFLLNASWGNGRGSAIKAGWELFCEMPFSKKMLGAGPDCFSSLAYSLPKTAQALKEAFGNSRLTNAHNELLTCLVNTGIIGVLLYLGILFSFMGRCLKKGQAAKELYPLAACVFCYLAHNLVSFSHVLNLTFLFLLMGMGEAILRQCPEDFYSEDFQGKDFIKVDKPENFIYNHGTEIKNHGSSRE